VGEYTTLQHELLGETDERMNGNRREKPKDAEMTRVEEVGDRIVANQML
jgi:hypothetical protein